MKYLPANTTSCLKQKLKLGRFKILTHFLDFQGFVAYKFVQPFVFCMSKGFLFLPCCQLQSCHVVTVQAYPQNDLLSWLSCQRSHTKGSLPHG